MLERVGRAADEPPPRRGVRQAQPVGRVERSETRRSIATNHSAAPTAGYAWLTHPTQQSASTGSYYTSSSKNSAFPAKAGTHSSTAPSPDRWIPAFAGNADFQVMTSALFAHREAQARLQQLAVLRVAELRAAPCAAHA